MRRKISLLSALLFAAAPVQAGWFQEALEGALQGAGERAVGEATDGAYEGVKGKVLGGRGSEAAGDEEEAPKPAKKGKSQATAKGESASAPAAGGDEKAYRNFDFIPGSKVIFFDDFSDTDTGEFPRKWTIQGPLGGGHTMEVVTFQGKKFLQSVPTGNPDTYQQEARAYLRLKNVRDLPEKFTIEFDAVLGPDKNPDHGTSEKFYILHLIGGGDEEQVMQSFGSIPPGNLAIGGEEADSPNTSGKYAKSDNRLHHISVAVNGTSVKVYVDGEKVINDPEGIARPIRLVGLAMNSKGGMTQDNLMFTNFRLAEGGKSMKSALDTDGRIVAHGITFDTGSDRLRPESVSTLREILALLQGNPSLKLSVEGHTDNTGGKGVNQPLSEKRAAAVKAWLCGKGIAEGRLSVRGVGDSRPMSPNDSPEGRANNRRVEFVGF